jgi:hypothetical protein
LKRELTETERAKGQINVRLGEARTYFEGLVNAYL